MEAINRRWGRRNGRDSIDGQLVFLAVRYGLVGVTGIFFFFWSSFSRVCRLMLKPFWIWIGEGHQQNQFRLEKKSVCNKLRNVFL